MSIFKKCTWCGATEGTEIIRSRESRLRYAIKTGDGMFVLYPGGERVRSLPTLMAESEVERIVIDCYKDRTYDFKHELCANCGAALARGEARRGEEKPNRYAIDRRDRARRSQALPTPGQASLFGDDS